MRLAKHRLGPPQRARPYRVDSLIELASSSMAMPSPLFMPFHVVLIGTLLMLRFAELICLLYSDVAFEKDRERVTIRISASKTDASAKSVKLRWSCSCGGATSTLQWKCVYHLILGVVDKLAHPIGSDDPIFGTCDGRRLTPGMIRRFLEMAHARAHGGIDVDEIQMPGDPASHFSSHSLRRSGAQFWHLAGMSDALLKRIARWRSEIIEIYLANAPLQHLGGRHPVGVAMDIPEISVERLLGKVREMVARHFEKLKCVENRAVSSRELKIVVTRNPGKVHECIRSTGPITEWGCRCGFKFGRAANVAVEVVQSVEEACSFGNLCNRGCFKRHPP